MGERTACLRGLGNDSAERTVTQTEASLRGLVLEQVRGIESARPSGRRGTCPHFLDEGPKAANH